MIRTNNTTILKVLVGSRAYGTSREDSDYDYRGVFILPTSQLLAIGSKPKTTDWFEGKEDNTLWELAHFCQLALHCNPTILETLVAQPVEITPYGCELQRLFPHFLDADRITFAFKGYASNQRKKMFDKEISHTGSRWTKFAQAYIRVLYQGSVLLAEGRLSVRLPDAVIKQLLKIKNEELSKGDVIDLAAFYEDQIGKQLSRKKHRFCQDIDKINKFILRVRKENWEEVK